MNEQELFLALVAIGDAAERSAQLEQACGDDSGLKRRIECLLQAHDHAGRFLESPAAPLATVDFPRVAERPGETIGPYKLLQQIGEGGFGVVYMAEQLEPVRRKVALKIIKPGMDTHEVIARFESERQALALMDHPNIARVLDAGATASGRPYFVMELVQGLPITEFADKNRLTVEQRLPLFVDVCRAVQHAHQKGVIHRDLKPTNVMVTLHDGRPVVKVIDFGVAKATSQQLTQRTLFTAYGQMIGTPAYMSPEQAEMSGLDIDTRTDIYSLGVLLYELLTGTTPLEPERLRAAGFAEMQRLIREEEPQRPSTRFSTLGAQATALANSRGTDARRLGQFLRGDLDWIVMKSLEKDRNRRYETPGEFAADVERFLSHDAIAARPPSAVYRFRKLVRRNSVAFAVAAISCVGAVASTHFGFQATRQAARAANAEKSAQRNLLEAEKKGTYLAAAKEELRATLYAAEMNLIQGAWEGRQFDRVSALLDKQRPSVGLSDLRGWEWHYWRRQLARGFLHTIDVPDLKRLGPDSVQGSALAFTADGERLAAILLPPPSGPGAFDDPCYEEFDVASGRQLKKFALSPVGEGEVPPALSITRDGERFLHASGKLTNWQSVVRDGRSGETIALVEPVQLPGRQVGMGANIAISPDGALVVEIHGAMSASPFERTSRMAPYEETVSISDATTGKRVRVFPSQRGANVHVMWRLDSKQLLRQTLTHDGESFDKVRHQFQLFDAATGAEIWSRAEASSERNLRLMTPRACSPDGRLIAVATASFDDEARLELWDANTGKTLATLTRPVQSSMGEPNVAFSPDGRMLAHGAQTEIHLWDLPELPSDLVEPVRVGAPSITLPNAHGRLRGLAFSEDGREIRAATAAAITSWDATLRDEPDVRVSRTAMTSSFGSDASRLIVRDNLGAISVWDASREQRLCTLPLQQEGSAPLMRLNVQTFSPDGKLLALSGMELRLHFFDAPDQRFHRTIRLYDAQDGRVLANFNVGASPWPDGLGGVGAVSFRPDGQQMAAVESTRIDFKRPAKLRMWDLRNYRELPAVDLPATSAVLLGYSADGRTLYVSINDQGRGQVACLDASTHRVRETLTFPHEVFIAHTLQGRVAVLDQGDLVYYDLSTGRERVRLQGFDPESVAVISPDGRRLAVGVEQTGSPHSQIVVWSLESGRRMLSLKGPEYLLIAFTGDGRRLLARSFRWPGDQPSQVWDATPLPESDAP